jgi:hypothetical protein
MVGPNNIDHHQENTKSIFLSKLLYPIVDIFRMKTMIPKGQEETTGRCSQYVVCHESNECWTSHLVEYLRTIQLALTLGQYTSHGTFFMFSRIGFPDIRRVNWVDDTFLTKLAGGQLLEMYLTSIYNDGIEPGPQYPRRSLVRS